MNERGQEVFRVEFYVGREAGVTADSQEMAGKSHILFELRSSEYLVGELGGVNRIFDRETMFFRQGYHELLFEQKYPIDFIMRPARRSYHACIQFSLLKPLNLRRALQRVQPDMHLRITFSVKRQEALYYTGARG